jgi:hypothetical protein
VHRILWITRSVVIALLLGLIALRAAAARPGSPETAGGAVAQQQAAAQVGTRHEARVGPAKTYRWDNTGDAQLATALLADERTSASQTMVRIAQASLIIGLALLGLAITSTSLYSDLKRRRRILYRPRGP